MTKHHQVHLEAEPAGSDNENNTRFSLECVQTPAKHYQDIVCDNRFNQTRNQYNNKFGKGLFDNLEFCSSHIAPQLVRCLPLSESVVLKSDVWSPGPF